MSNRKPGRAPENKARRKMTGKVAVTVSMASLAWHKPVVESVVLPAHAQLSPDDEPMEEPVSFTLDCTATGQFTCAGTTPSSFIISSEAATLTPPEAGVTIQRDLINPDNSFAVSGSTAVFITDGGGIAVGPGLDDQFICASAAAEDNVSARYIVLNAPDVEPCLVPLTLIN